MMLEFTHSAYSGLEAEYWRFWLNTALWEPILQLDVYKRQRRATKRHKFVDYAIYSRLPLPRTSLEVITNPPLTEAIKAEAIRRFSEMLTVSL